MYDTTVRNTMYFMKLIYDGIDVLTITCYYPYALYIYINYNIFFSVDHQCSVYKYRRQLYTTVRQLKYNVVDIKFV